MTQQYELYACGTRGSMPVGGEQFLQFGGQTTCYIIKKGTDAVVLDCGTGLGNGISILKDCTRVDIILTHMHYDHIMGLLWWGQFPKEAKITIYSTFSLWHGDKTIDRFFETPYWPICPTCWEIKDVERNTKIRLGDSFAVEFYPASHPDGGNLVRMYAGDKVVCCMFDYEHTDDSFLDKVDDCELLLYDGMYSEEEYVNHIGWGHSTWQQGCRIAKERNVKRLWITHHEPKRTDEQLIIWENEAKKLFSGCRFARSNDMILL